MKHDFINDDVAFEEGGIGNALFPVRDGEEALEYLEGRGRYWNRAEFPVPDIVLLDIKMPGMDGLEVLRYVRQQPEFKALRVMMLASSDDISDINEAYELGANSFVVKPVDFEDYVRMVCVVARHWLEQRRSPGIRHGSKRGITG